MDFQSIRKKLLSIEQIPLLLYFFKWLFFSLLVGILVGSASAFFLISLDWATNFREAHTYIIWFLPIAGLIIGLSYYYWGNNVVKGNNQLLEEFHSPKQIIPFKMAPLVLFGTLITHLFGGSAGREGTAVQMGGAIADRFTKLFKLRNRDRKTLLIMGISAGFASVFGTPIAGAVFAIEVLVIGRMRYEAIFPSIMVAVIAHYTCLAYPVIHTQYEILQVPSLTITTFGWTLFAGLLFGLTALLFSKSVKFWTTLFAKYISYAPFRPLIGGLILAIVIWAIGTTKYIGLGIPQIVDAFSVDTAPYDFAVKILFTAFTLGAGFKGGEVTPLFFIGATLGNALVWFIPLPVALLAGMGFVAVFAGATNTPIACTFMGIELFGVDGGIFIAIACITAYFFSGHSGIYSSQVIGSPKHLIFGRLKGEKLSAIRKKENT